MLGEAGTKTISLLLLMLIGWLFSRKIGQKAQRDGIRTLILSLALPATIFVALLKIDFVPGLMIVPLMALAFNIVVFVVLSKLPVHSLFNLQDNQYKTLILLIPSLAPGLSAFPFILEYSGESSLAIAALADLGNKIFVLVIAYLLAMKWYFDRQGVSEIKSQSGSRFRLLLLSLVNEPVNLAILAAIVMLALGLQFNVLPLFMQSAIDKLSLMMTPLVLLFIGLSMKLTWSQVKAIVSFLFFRSGIAFALSALVLIIVKPADVATALLIVVFPQSACSFWPYAHMAIVGELEEKKGVSPKTFDLDFAMNVLACSMPFSVMLILSVYSSGTLFTTPSTLITTSLVFIAAAALPVLLSARAKSIQQSVADSSPTFKSTVDSTN